MYMAGDHFQKLIISRNHAYSRDRSQVVRLGSMHLYQLRHPAGPQVNVDFFPLNSIIFNEFSISRAERWKAHIRVVIKST